MHGHKPYTSPPSVSDSTGCFGRRIASLNLSLRWFIYEFLSITSPYEYETVNPLVILSGMTKQAPNISV